MERRRRATLRDVAAKAQVSTAVVSYVINNGPRPTSPETRRRVLEAIAELDYHPNGIARGLRARRTHTIGFVANDYYPFESFASHYLSSILSALTAELTAHGYYLLIYPLMVGEELAPLERLLRGGRLDGVVARLVQDPPATDPVLELIKQAEMPCVCIERPAAARFGIRSVGYDDAGGAEAATRHLIARGHRRIAHLHGDPRYASAQARRAGYERALRAAGLPIAEDLIRVASWSMTEAAAATHDLLTLADPPTAIFAASDDMALGVVETLRATGRRVGADVAVVGFDGIPLGQAIVPPLTSVRIPLAEIGRRAAELILRDPDREREPAPEVLPVELIAGQTG